MSDFLFIGGLVTFLALMLVLDIKICGKGGC